MRTKTKVWLIIATILILVGCILMGVVLNMANWNLAELGSGKFKTNKHDIQDTFFDICIRTDTADIQFIPSTDGTTSVECYEQEKVVHSVTVTDSTLVIKVQDTRKWYEHIGVHFVSPKITVSLPQGRCGNLSIETDTGDVNIDRAFSFDSMKISGHTGQIFSSASVTNDIQISNSTGSVRIEDMVAGSIQISVSTGKIAIKGVVRFGDLSTDLTTGKANFTNIGCKNFSSKGDTGDVTLDGCDGGEILIETDTGDIKITRKGNECRPSRFFGWGGNFYFM